MDGDKDKYFVKLPFPVMVDDKLSGTDVRIYCAIKSFADFKSETNCFPSIEKIASRSNTSTRTVNRSLSTLTENGHLIYEQGHKGRANTYQFTDYATPMSYTKSNYTTPASYTTDTGVATIATSVSHHQETYTEKQDQDCKAIALRDGLTINGKTAVSEPTPTFNGTLEDYGFNKKEFDYEEARQHLLAAWNM